MCSSVVNLGAVNMFPVVDGSVNVSLTYVSLYQNVVVPMFLFIYVLLYQRFPCALYLRFLLLKFTYAS